MKFRSKKFAKNSLQLSFRSTTATGIGDYIDKILLLQPTLAEQRTSWMNMADISNFEANYIYFLFTVTAHSSL